jgi:hypothetical protein
MKTFKQLVNNVLIRLREREVSSIDENSYSKLIGIFVHDAIESIETAWQWSNLRETVTVTTSAGVSTYVLTGTGDKSTILDVINDTSNCFMAYQTSHWFDNVFLNNTPASSAPKYYMFDGLDSVGDTQIKVYPVPEGVYSLKVKVVKRSPAIIADDDTVKVPFLPVQALAYAMALEERGEDGGISAISAKTLAHGYLSDAISIDANKHPEELIWEAP